MRTFNLFTAFAVHFVLTICLTVAVVYGEYRVLKALPEFDRWLGQTGDWTLGLMLALAFVIGREISFHFVGRVILPWLDSNSGRGGT